MAEKNRWIGILLAVIFLIGVLVISDAIIAFTNFDTSTEEQNNKAADTIYFMFTTILAIINILVVVGYVYLYFKIRFSLPNDMRTLKIRCKLTTFFSVMVVMILARNIYYIYLRYDGYIRSTQPISEIDIIIQFYSELAFNIAVLYFLYAN